MASQVIQPSARAALEHYKQRDTSKGMLVFTCPWSGKRGKLISSGRQVQVNRFSTYNEDYRIQSYCFQSISGGDSLPEGSTRVQSY